MNEMIVPDATFFFFHGEKAVKSAKSVFETSDRFLCKTSIFLGCIPKTRFITTKRKTLHYFTPDTSFPQKQAGQNNETTVHFLNTILIQGISA